MKSSQEHKDIGFEGEKERLISLRSKRMKSLIREKTEQIWSYFKKAEKRKVAGQETTEEKPEKDTAIRAPTWQDVTCRVQEEETRQI